MHWNLVNDSNTLNGIETTRGSTMKALNRVYNTITMDLVSCAVFSALYDYSKPDVLADRVYYQQGNDPIIAFRLTCKKHLDF